MSGDTPQIDDGQAAMVVLHAEDIAITKRSVQTGVVRVATTTHVRSQTVEEALGTDTVEIERVSIGRVVPIAPDIRQEGDVTIVPVMEEVLIVEKRLMLKEELRIRRVRGTKTHRETVQLREQVADITREAAGSNSPIDALRSIKEETT